MSVTKSIVSGQETRDFASEPDSIRNVWRTSRMEKFKQYSAVPGPSQEPLDLQSRMLWNTPRRMRMINMPCLFLHSLE